MNVHHAILSRAVDVLTMSASVLLVIGSMVRGIARDAAPSEPRRRQQPRRIDREPLIGPMAF